MTRQLTIYVVFHKDLFASNTAAFLKHERNNLFVWIGVNADVPKLIPPSMMDSPIVYEYKMPRYNPMYQKNNFYQNSVFFHLYKNPMYLQSKFVGFAQYDMRFSRTSIPTLTDDCVYGYFPYKIEDVWNYYPYSFWTDCFLDTYNKYYTTTHTFEDLARYPIFLYHTFIIPTHFFLHMMPFIEHSTDVILNSLNNETRHIAGTLERVFGLCIACGLAEGRLKGYAIQRGISHISEQHTDDPVRGIVRGQFSHS